MCLWERVYYSCFLFFLISCTQESNLVSGVWLKSFREENTNPPTLLVNLLETAAGSSACLSRLCCSCFLDVTDDVLQWWSQQLHRSEVLYRTLYLYIKIFSFIFVIVACVLYHRYFAYGVLSVLYWKVMERKLIVLETAAIFSLMSTKSNELVVQC